LPSSATYVGVGDPNLVNITHLEGHQRYFLVGLNDGKTNLIVINENGLQKSVIQVGKKIDDSTRTHISLVDSSSVLQVLDRRPTNLVVANKQIASAKLQRTKDGKYGVTITGHSPGDTDILLSLGLEHRPVWYTVHVETE
jgi:Flp pilus assembly secretin CpaC